MAKPWTMWAMRFYDDPVAVRPYCTTCHDRKLRRFRNQDRDWYFRRITDIDRRYLELKGIYPKCWDCGEVIRPLDSTK